MCGGGVGQKEGCVWRRGRSEGGMCGGGGGMCLLATSKLECIVVMTVRASFKLILSKKVDRL